MTLAELSTLVDVPERILTRWGLSGKAREWLDVVHRPGRGWLTSLAAWQPGRDSRPQPEWGPAPLPDRSGYRPESGFTFILI